MMFSTYDSDHDHSGYSSGCAGNFGGGWWYNNCFHANLNGDYASWFGWWACPYGAQLAQSRMMMKAI